MIANVKIKYKIIRRIYDTFKISYNIDYLFWEQGDLTKNDKVKIMFMMLILESLKYNVQEFHDLYIIDVGYLVVYTVNNFQSAYLQCCTRTQVILQTEQNVHFYSSVLTFGLYCHKV